MRDEQILRLEEMDSRHWWAKNRLKIISKTVKGCGIGDSCIFEIGAGSGFTLKYLKDCGFKVLALEPTQYGAKSCREFGIETINNTLESLNQLPPKVGCILLLDVLEHIEKDVKSLRRLFDLADENTFLIITVPADPRLWSKLDEDVSHFRRYTRITLLTALEQSGWTTLYFRYWMSILKPIVWIRRQIIKGDFNSETRLPSKPINNLLSKIVNLEYKISLIGKIPGTSIIAVARKI